MKIGIDASRMLDGIKKTGVEVVGDIIVKNLFKELIKEHKVILYTPELLDSFSKTNQRVIKFYRLWTIFRLSWEMLFHKPDIFFSPIHELPFFCPDRTYRIVHDVAYLKTPENYSVFQRWYLRYGLKRSLKICKKIFVSTKSVKKDILKYYPEVEGSIIVISFGFNRKNHENKISEKENKLVYIGRIESKKNISRLVEAFEIFSKTNPDYKLILAGKSGFGFEKIKIKIKESDAAIELLGYIDETEKDNLQSTAKAIILISYEEGFGITVLEGFDMGTRVVASDIPVLREVGGDIPVYVNPNSVDSIASGFEKIIKDDRFDIEKGFSRVDEFRWDIVIDKIKNNLI